MSLQTEYILKNKILFSARISRVVLSPLPFQFGAYVLGTHFGYGQLADVRVAEAESGVTAAQPLAGVVRRTLECIHR